VVHKQLGADKGKRRILRAVKYTLCKTLLVVKKLHRARLTLRFFWRRALNIGPTDHCCNDALFYKL